MTKQKLTEDMTPCTKTQDIEEIKRKLSEMEGMSADIAAIRNALLGDEFHPGNGLVNGVKAIDGRVSRVEKFQYRVLVWVGVILALSAAFMAVFDFYLKLRSNAVAP